MTKKVNPEENPNTLEPIKPISQKNRRPLTIIIVVLAILLAVLYFSLMNAGQKPRQDEPERSSSPGQGNFMAGQDAGRGVIQPPGKAEKDQAGQDGEDEFEPIKVIGPPPKDPEAEARRREIEEIRRKKMETEQAALKAGPMVKRVSGDTAAKVSESANGRQVEYLEGPSASTSDYDPAADQDKENFFSRADQNQWRSPYTREVGRPFELKTGAVIPGVMVTGVNSDLPGAMIAQVSQNVYDTATGQRLLIPQGAKLYGVYDSRVVYGQRRVLIAWNRIVFPDGSSVTLGAMPGADMAGYAGYQDKVDNHYVRIFGSAILMSLISGGMAYSVDKVSNNDSDSDSTTVQDEMAAALAAQLGQTALTLLQKNINIKPTLEIRPGYRFNIVVTKDVVFRGAYQ